MQSYNRANYLIGLQNLSANGESDNDLLTEMFKSEFITDMASCDDKSQFSSAFTIVNTSPNVPLDLKELMTEINKLKNTVGGRQRSNKKSRNLRKRKQRRQSRQRY